MKIGAYMILPYLAICLVCFQQCSRADRSELREAQYKEIVKKQDDALKNLTAATNRLIKATQP